MKNLVSLQLLFRLSLPTYCCLLLLYHTKRHYDMYHHVRHAYHITPVLRFSFCCCSLSRSLSYGQMDRVSYYQVIVVSVYDITTSSTSVRLWADEAKTIRVKQRAARITYKRNSRHMLLPGMKGGLGCTCDLRPILYVSETHMIDTYSYTNGVTQQKSAVSSTT